MKIYKYYWKVLMVVLLISTLTSCFNNGHSERTAEFIISESTDFSSKGDNVTSLPSKKTSELAIFASVIINETPFINSFTRETETLEHFLLLFNGDKSKIVEFAVIDLDHDNVSEVVLYQGDQYGGIILHNKKGVVFAYPFWYRMFLDLKEDGSFYGSGGSSGEYAIIESFSSDCTEFGEITKILGGFLFSNNTTGDSFTEYYIGNKPVNEEEYLLFDNEQKEKMNVTLHEFSIDNFNSYR